MRPAEFETPIPASDWPQSLVLDRPATGIGILTLHIVKHTLVCYYHYCGGCKNGNINIIKNVNIMEINKLKN